VANDFFMDALNAVSGEEFDEIPVDIKTFVESTDFLSAEKQYRLSDYQYQMVKAMTQIYKYETLVHLMGQVEAKKRWEETYGEVIMQLGKGSGKDFTSTVAVAYIVYLCLCLKNPTKYYNNASIDIINIAINADQAQRVFFKNFMELIKGCAWFQKGEYDAKRDSVEFDKNINVYSGHSEREAYEGYNTMVIILDEISGFALESNTGNVRAKTAPEIYEWARGSVDSRFAEFGKVCLLSFPRFNHDYIQQKYDEAVAEKETIDRSATVMLRPELGPQYEGNLLEIKWEEDHIIRYEEPGVWALKRPSWEVNPTKDLQTDYSRAFFRNYADALGRFACMPSDNTEDSFIKNKQAILDAFIANNGVTDEGIFLPNFRAKEGVDYYLHVDLSKVHDRCAVAMAHVDKWVTHSEGQLTDVYPSVRVDVVRWWKPNQFEPMDYKKVTDFIMALRRRGFNLKLVTFDRWQSHDTINYLRDHHIESDMLSVANKHYDDFLATLYDERLIGPNIPELIDELRELRYIKDKIDHPRAGYKDLSDAVAGAIYNAVTYTLKPQNQNVEVISYKSLMRKQREEEPVRKDGVIRPPKRKMPDEIRDNFSTISVSEIKVI
jgi:hypothetical protein